MRRTNLSGHALRSEGKPYEDIGDGWQRVCRGSHPPTYAGAALCQCGWASVELHSDAERKRAHGVHKDEIRNESKEQNDGRP